MPSSLTKVSATPHALKYEFVTFGADSLSITRAQVIADCVPGPLKGLLEKITAVNDWLKLPRREDFSVYTTVTDGSCETSAIFQALQLTAQSSAAASVIIELRYIHSLLR